LVKKASENQTRVVVDFTAAWCGPCKNIAPIFKALSARFPKIEFWKVDESKCKLIVQGLNITSYPTFHYYIGETLVLQHTGADKAVLEKNLTKLNEKTKEELLSTSDSKKDSFVEGDLHLFQDEKQCECLNDSQEYPFVNLFADNEKACKSDSDEQLLLTIGYQSLVRAKSIKIIGPSGCGPKEVRIFVNSPNLEFDSAEEKVPTQTLKLSANDLLRDTKVISLDTLKFASVNSLTLFIVNNQSNAEVTEVSRIIVNGMKA